MHSIHRTWTRPLSISSSGAWQPTDSATMALNSRTLRASIKPGHTPRDIEKTQRPLSRAHGSNEPTTSLKTRRRNSKDIPMSRQICFEVGESGRGG